MTNQQIQIHCPAIPDPGALLFRRMRGSEGLSEAFRYEVELLSKTASLDLDQVLGQEMSVSVELGAGAKRYFHGYVASFGHAGEDGEYSVYKAVLRPHLWRLTRTTNCRVFQKTNVPDIVAELLREHRIAHFTPHYNGGNRGAYLPWDYCVQYRESDFNFISRLLEHEGIHYFFKHEKDKHTLVLTDSTTGHPRVPGYETVEYRRAAGGVHNHEGLWTWQTTRQVLPGTYAGRDFDFLNPTTPVHRASSSTVERKHARAMNPDYEIYDHPEGVVQQTGYSPQSMEDLARIRIEEIHSEYEVIAAESNARGLCTAALFKVLNGPGEALKNNEYLVIGASVDLEMNAYSSGGEAEGPSYGCTVRAINAKHHYRPPRTTPKPMIRGPQSATVVGKSGEKVDTDEHGRVKVQFHWDRKGKSDQDSSCWVRVSQNWAGANWGGMFLPHLGQEVIVAFLEGDPDRPIIIGRVYNSKNKPPVALPANKLKSIIRDHFGNEIVLDGTPGKESLSLHSPSHHSVLQLGRSVRTFTHSKQASCTFDSESYQFGTKISYTKGQSFSVDRGMWASIKAGAGISATLGAEASLSGGTKLTLAAGGNVSLSLSWSCSWGYARELKYTKGSYKRSSSSDVLLDSQKSIFITGGKNDNTLIMSNDDEMTLSYDDSKSNRAAQMKAADTKVKVSTTVATALISAGAAAGVYGYSRNISNVGPIKDLDAKTATIDADFENISKIAWADAGVLGSAALAAASSVTGFPGQDVENPKHPDPSAKLTVKKNFIEAFVGRGQKSKLSLSEDNGLLFESNKRVVLDADEGILYKSAKDVTVEAETQMMIKAIIKHKNLTVLK